ncbi:hypothetical protein VTO42DRAFT_5791 [Malbranchea cinnamomea]
MAAALKRQKPIGSKEWIIAEKENVQMLVDQELEEVVYPARHEMEWLNEHMAEIFRGNSLNVAELFKTPGKMRGKTPRTIRKHQTPRSARVPLSEIFSATRNKSPLARTHFNHDIAGLAENKEKTRSPLSQKQNSNSYFNTDSGYHGMPDDDDMQMIPSQQPTEPDLATQPATQEQVHTPPKTLRQAQDESTPAAVERRRSDSVRRATQDSFHSAREVAPSKETTVEPTEMDFQYTFPPRSQQAGQPEYPSLPATNVHPRSPPSKTPTTTTLAEIVNSPRPAEGQGPRGDDPGTPLDDVGLPSDHSSPDRPPIRKSSLSFASLPAREPLMKRSMGGARNSYIDRGFFGRQTGGARVTQMLGAEKADAADKTDVDGGERAPTHTSEEAKQHGKSSTQLLHEKINMLGKSQPPRTTKSISANPQPVTYPDLPTSKPDPAAEKARAPREQTPVNDPPNRSLSQRPQLSRQNTETSTTRQPDVQAETRKPTVAPETRSPGHRMFNPARFFHGKSNSASSIFTSPLPQKNTEGTNPDQATTTPVNSPRRYEGPLSASKERLQSIMKTAKGLFTSSAGISAAARQESQSPLASRADPKSSPLQNRAEPPKHVPPESPVRPEGRRTRSSTEREQRRREEEMREQERKEREARERQEREEREERERKKREEQQLARAREEEKQQAYQAKTSAPAMQTLDSVVVPVAKGAGQSSPRKVQPPPTASESSRDDESRYVAPKPKSRPVKPTREAAKPKPQPVSIRVGTHSQRVAMSQHQAASSAVADPAPTGSTSKLSSAEAKNASTASLHTAASSSSFKSTSSTSSTKSKTTLATKKREQEAQKRLEQRREAERKRAAQQEEARRQEQAEAERRERERLAHEDPKKAAQLQAIEKRRLENQRKLEQQRAQQATPSRSRASTLHQDRPAAITSQRNEQSAVRPPSRLNGAQRPINVPLPNPAKPPKRAVDEEGSSRVASTKPGVVQQSDGKRRKTDEEVAQEPPVRPTMAPPIRQSGVRKDTMKPHVFAASGYSTMPAQHSQGGGPSVYRNPSLGPRQFPAPAPAQPARGGHPLDMSKYASGKIPFAEPPSNTAQIQPPPHYSVHKTPAHAQRPPKSSPAYPNGDSIKLPEIPTDSEDSDSDAEPYNVPEWAREENLGQILMEQEGRDGDAVFGPFAPLQMEEIFKDNKERFKRFRDRTSSANWLTTGDGLTAEEVRWDLAERERLKRNGGWTYNPRSPA